MPHQMSGKVAFVTGAGSGMGAATAQLLAEYGASVGLFDRHRDNVDAVAAAIISAGGRAVAVGGDVSVPGDVQRGVQMTVETFGALHYGVNNAGITGYFERIDELSVEKWNEVVSINLSGLFYAMKFEIPQLLAAGGGAIVNISSVFADRGGPTTDYSSAKHGIRGLTRTAAKDYGRDGIRVNELQPGVIDTAMSRANPEGTQQVVETGIPLARIGTGRDIAAAVAFLLSDEAAYITGAHLAVDGGFLA